MHTLTDIARDIVMARPSLAREENESGNSPMHLCVLWNKLDVIRVLLQYDPSLGYLINSHTNAPLLVSAAFRGNIGAAKEILKYCPDAPYCRQDGWTMLHEAICQGHEAFVEFILETPDQRHNLINRKDIHGETALHIAVTKCNPKVVRSLMAHEAILDLTVVSKRGDAPESSLMSDTMKLAKTLDRNDVLKIMEILDYEGSASDTMKRAKTLDWTEVLMMMKNANPESLTLLPRQEAKREITEKSIEEIKTLTNTYTNSTSIVAVLIATITFTAAFTLPGGYSNDSGSEGLPVLARKAAFKAFIISDTLAMCSSLAVAFICVIYRWEDRKFLLHYRSLTEKLMWFAYMATTVAFATGLYTVLKPRITWLAILICLLPIVPFLTYLLGKWPIWKLRWRLGSAYKSDLLDLLDMV
ncbi:ankyrin repeat family protein [Rhynchospora pubera]|uniref:Ankyrin repeat family protein n=2 Tax=Rhynchospora pubera TaxID=906938 RepID=A0AAV8HLP1_9POAL|nr:ankyrin repeat family protein [Rhynchospora pubera]